MAGAAKYRMRKMKNVLAFLIFIGFLSFAFAGEKHWAYRNSPTAVAPEKWGDLPGDELCALGKNQTPIDLPGNAPVDATAPKLEPHYVPSPINLVNNGHTVQMDLEPGSTLNVGEKSYKLLQFHFHAGSEHSIAGRFFPMELHLVHTNPEGKAALVIGVMINEGRHNASLDPIFSNMPKKSGEKKIVQEKFDASAFIPQNSGYYFYDGSLTTPPCSEGIKWVVMKTPIEMDRKQIQAFTSIPGFNHTARPLQPVGTRKIEQSKG